jgi:hypothetical protein
MRDLIFILIFGKVMIIYFLNIIMKRLNLQLHTLKNTMNESETNVKSKYPLNRDVFWLLYNFEFS